MSKISRFYDSARACIDLLTNFTDFIIFYQAESLYPPHKLHTRYSEGQKEKNMVFQEVRALARADFVGSFAQ